MGLRINNNLASLNASMNLGRANSTFNSSMAKLSTGLRINSAADGPADLIISEKFRAQITAIDSAVQNTQNAISMLSTAEGALNEVNTLLNKMQGLALKAAQTGTQSADEVAASQAEIDAALESINNISRNTSFGSLKLLDGSQAIETTAVDTSQVLVNIDKANFAGESKNMDIQVVAAAERASTSIDLTAAAQNDASGTDGILSNNQSLKITGSNGSDTFTFASGTSITDMAEAITSRVTQTGVYAEAEDNVLKLSSADFGATEFVTVEDVDGTNDLLDITGGAVGSMSPEAVSQGFEAGGVTFRTTTEAGDKFKGYSVQLTVAGTAATAVAVNDDAKTIVIAASVGASANGIRAALATGTSVSWENTIGNSAHTFAANDATSGIVVDDIYTKLNITAKAGGSASTHKDKATLIIDTTAALGAGAASAAYNDATNTLTVTVDASTAYTTDTIQSAIFATGGPSAATLAIRDMFDFSMLDGGGAIKSTDSNEVT